MRYFLISKLFQVEKNHYLLTKINLDEDFLKFYPLKEEDYTYMINEINIIMLVKDEYVNFYYNGIFFKKLIYQVINIYIYFTLSLIWGYQALKIGIYIL